MAGDAHLKHLKLNPPPVLKLKGDVRANFEKWQKLYQNYVKTAKLNVLPDEERIDILFNLAGEDVILVQDKILEALSENHQKKYDKVYKELEFYCRNLYEYNEVYERFALHTRTQKPGEPFQTFYEDLCEKAATCNFESKLEREKQIRDCIVKGVTDEELRTVLLEMRNLTLEFAVQKCRSAERVAQQSTAMQRARPEVMAVNAVDSGTKTAQSPASSNGKQGDKGSKRRTSNFTRKCGRCDTLHDYKKCPAYGHTCEKCKSRNHLEAVCRAVIPSAPINPTAPPFKPAVNELQVIDNGLEENFYVDSVASSAGHSRSGWWVTLPLQDMELDFKLDPGADVNILPLKAVLDRGCQEKIRSANVYLKVYDPFNNIPPIKCLGYVTLYIMVNNVLHSIEFVVSEGDATPIIGAKSCLQLGLVKLLHDVHMTAVQTESYDIKSKFIADNNDVFSGIGHFPGQYSFVIEPGAKLKNSPPHRIPFAVRDRLKLLLDKHEASGIVKKVDVISPDMMISNLVITEKPNGDIRVCLDPCELNKILKRSSHEIKTLEDILLQMSNKSWFSVLDLKDGFYHVELDQASANKCCFVTSFGVYQFLRLPFGVKTAPEEFQKRNDLIFGCIPGVIVYFDDLCVAASTEEEHDAIMKQVLTAARGNNVKFNPSKLQYKQREIRYVGLLFSEAGHMPDSERVRALLGMKSPNTTKELKRALAMFGYLRMYIPHMSSLISPFRPLLKAKTQWIWLPEHESAYQQLKKALADVTVLACYDVSKPVYVHADACKDGLGACLLQDRPVAFASRGMNSSEINYSMSEKELLAVVFAFKKFHNYVYGRSVLCLTDHKPLVAVMSKPLSSIGSDRLKRLRLKLQKYDIDLIYQPGPLMYVADQLSRSYLDETEPEDPQMIEVIHSVTANCPVTKTNLECIREATAKDITLSCVIKYVQDGWPAQISKIPVDVRPYWSHKVSLHVENGILLLDSRIVVPLALRSIMLEKLHAGHSGVPKTVSRAQQSLYWPNYRTDIANFVDSCETCNKFARRKSPAELLQHEIPNQPWQAIGVDIAEYGGVSYLVVADLFSKWLIIEPLKDKSTCSVIDVFLTIFADHGFPETLYCDNNPLDSYEFKVFAKGRFSVVTSSPTYAKSNGFAEKYVGIAKDILKKSCHLNVNFRILLREYRATPLSNLNVSPAQIHLSRQIKTDVPVLPELLKPKLIHQEVHEKMIAFQAQVKVAHDKRVMRPVKTFQPGDVVNVRSRIDSTWEPGTVVGVCDKPRSYFVRNNRGRVVRRNESHMSLKVPRNKPGPIQDVITDLVHDDEPDVSEPQYVLQMPFDADDQEIDPFDIPAYIFDL